MIKFTLIFLGFAWISAAPGFASVDPDVAGVVSSFEVGKDRVSIPANSIFARQLQLTTINGKSEEKALKIVGQMIALANHSANLSAKATVSWVELEPTLSRSLGVNFSQWKEARVGEAIGLAWVPLEYANQLGSREKVFVSRYGLPGSHVLGQVITVGKAISSSNETSPRIPVLFRLGAGQTWYPGTNCQVEFPLIRGHTSHLSSTAVLHEGIREYVFKEIAPGQYSPEAISIISEKEGSAEVLGNLKPGDRVIENGAILLKPLLSSLLDKKI